MKTVYTTIKHNNTRICGILDSDSNMVMVNIVNGIRLGGFLLSRFEGEKLTARTLNKLFTG